jgi:hypothetical protein
MAGALGAGVDTVLATDPTPEPNPNPNLTLTGLLL